MTFVTRRRAGLLARFLAASLALALTGAKPATRHTAPKAPAKESVLRVEVHPPVVTRQSYLRGHPPAHVRGITDQELGVCATQFGCTAHLRAEWSFLGDDVSPATVSALTLTTRQTIEIWTLEDSGPAVEAHEETHRLISEHFYALGSDVVRQLGRGVLGRKVPMSGRGKAAQPNLEQIERDLVAAYMYATSNRCEYAQQRFDTLTDHGRKPIANADAMKLALAEEALHWEQVKHLPPPPAKDVQMSTVRTR